MAYKGKGKSQWPVSTQSMLFDIPAVKRVVNEKPEKPQEEFIRSATVAKGLNGLFENCSREEGLRKFAKYVRGNKI